MVPDPVLTYIESFFLSDAVIYSLLVIFQHFTCLLFSIFRAFQHNTFYEYVTIITAYLCTTFLYQYKNIRKPLYLLAGIGSGLAALLCAALFLWVNWP